MTQESSRTHFAPAETACREVVERQSRLVAEDPILGRLYDAVNDCVFILNEQRQIVFYNARAAELLELDRRSKVYGQRPGKAVGCVHAAEAHDSCGTTKFCTECGAVNAIMSTQDGSPAVRECRILREEGQNALDLLVRATPMELSGQELTVVAIKDISDEKRRRALERTFFHDLMNIVLSLKLLCRNLQKAEPAESGRQTELFEETVEKLHEQIRAQRDLAAAEEDELPVQPEWVNARSLLVELRSSYLQAAEDCGCTIALDPAAQETSLKTDRTLLSRVLGNMIRNAVEATSASGQEVTLGCTPTEDGVTFWIHNEDHMPRDVQVQVFKRSFSTKGPGRGLGTYSMKLLTERYLGGRVWFESSQDDGTTFFAAYPRAIEE
jgi:signal transduction histidine kinase